MFANQQLPTILPIIDCLITELNRRGKAYEDINCRFGFMLKLEVQTNDQIADCCKELSAFYANDLDQEELVRECQHFKQYLAAVSQTEKPLSIADMYSRLKNEKLHATFPNMEIAMRIFLCMMVTNCTGERSFSKLKLIKNDLRSGMKQERLNYLSVMSIESDILELIDFSEIIRDFSEQKTRKRFM